MGLFDVKLISSLLRNAQEDIEIGERYDWRSHWIDCFADREQIRAIWKICISSKPQIAYALSI